tara:strand:- start:6202 stop:7092 length:891 start_codon:yes stop_codon:yes gene_type:complete
MATCRPKTFDDVIGQKDVVSRLKIFTYGCKNGGGVMPHVLIDGPPGLGKTTLASAIANDLGNDLVVANGASIRSVKNMTRYLLNIQPNTVLFIDEIHRLPMIVEEFMYPVMEDFKASVVLGSEPEEIDIPAFTLIGATTSGGSLSQPFYDRFTIKEHLQFYTVNELAKLAGLNAEALSLKISSDHLSGIAERSKGTPRILNARLEWYKNYTNFYPEAKNVDEIFNTQGIDRHGMDENDRKYLDILMKNRGNPLGIKSLSGMTGIAIDTIENSIEPYLVREGFVIRTQKGRVIGKTP